MKRTRQTEISRILAHLSHELRAPMGVVLGYLRLLEQRGEGLNERQQRAVAAAARAGAAAVTLLDEASELSRLCAGRVPLARTSVALASLLDVSARPAALPEDPAITLQVKCAPTLLVSVDEPRMRAAFRSIVHAVVRSQARPATIEVAATPRLARGHRYAHVTIAPQDVSHLRAREVQFDSAKGGHGLRLAIAVATIEAHAGRVRERRVDDMESGVSVRLPLAEPRPSA